MTKHLNYKLKISEVIQNQKLLHKKRSTLSVQEITLFERPELINSINWQAQSVTCRIISNFARTIIMVSASKNIYDF